MRNLRSRFHSQFRSGLNRTLRAYLGRLRTAWSPACSPTSPPDGSPALGWTRCSGPASGRRGWGGSTGGTSASTRGFLRRRPPGIAAVPRVPDGIVAPSSYTQAFGPGAAVGEQPFHRDRARVRVVVLDVEPVEVLGHGIEDVDITLLTGFGGGEPFIVSLFDRYAGRIPTLVVADPQARETREDAVTGHRRRADSAAETLRPGFAIERERGAPRQHGQERIPSDAVLSAEFARTASAISEGLSDGGRLDETRPGAGDDGCGPQRRPAGVGAPRFQIGYVPRPMEFGPNVERDLTPDPDFDWWPPTSTTWRACAVSESGRAAPTPCQGRDRPDRSWRSVRSSVLRLALDPRAHVVERVGKHFAPAP